MTTEPNKQAPTGTSSSRARGSEVRGGSEDDEVLDGGKSPDESAPSEEEADQSGTRGARGRPA